MRVDGRGRLPPPELDVPMQIQTYEPYRSSLLTRDELLGLYALRATRIVADTLCTWFWILLAWVGVAFYPYWWSAVVAILVIGTRFYALLIIAHDGLHRRLFKTVKSNDLWNDLLILGSIGAITRLNRINHMKHHRELALRTDPDRFKYTRSGRETPMKFLLSLTCVPLLVKAIRNVLVPGPAMRMGSEERAVGSTRVSGSSRYHLRDVAIIVIWQVLLIGGLSFSIGWWAYPVLWIVPVTFALCCDILRVFCEHSQLTDDDDADSSMRLVSYDANLIERVVFAPNNMNHHIAHHLWPAIPYYNLPKAERMIKPKLERNSQLVWRSSYFWHITNYWRWLSREKV